MQGRTPACVFTRFQRSRSSLRWHLYLYFEVYTKYIHRSTYAGRFYFLRGYVQAHVADCHIIHLSESQISPAPVARGCACVDASISCPLRGLSIPPPPSPHSRLLSAGGGETSSFPRRPALSRRVNPPKADSQNKWLENSCTAADYCNTSRLYI